MKNKDLIAHLEQFEPEAEVWIFDNRYMDHFKPGTPHGQYDYEDHNDVVVITFGSSLDGN